MIIQDLKSQLKKQEEKDKQIDKEKSKNEIEIKVQKNDSYTSEPTRMTRRASSLLKHN